jgi:hypothetical protein
MTDETTRRLTARERLGRDVAAVSPTSGVSRTTADLIRKAREVPGLAEEERIALVRALQWCSLGDIEQGIT